MSTTSTAAVVRLRPRIRTKLTKRAIETLPVGGEIRDPATRGLSVWRRKNVTAWSFQYTIDAGGRRVRKRVKLGEWPGVDLEEGKRCCQGTWSG